MSSLRRGRTVAIGLFWFGVLYGALVSILILAGVLSPGLWFTVIAMALLAISQGILLHQSITSTAQDAAPGTDARAEAQRIDAPRRED